jgi:hypothetical protein
MYQGTSPENQVDKNIGGSVSAACNNLYSWQKPVVMNEAIQSSALMRQGQIKGHAWYVKHNFRISLACFYPSTCQDRKPSSASTTEGGFPRN